jgi:DivIVA domain-containing protein
MALLTPKDIREHTFQTVRFKEGYDVDEVDDFLDQVTETVEALGKQAVASGQATQSLPPDVAKLNSKISELTAQVQSLQSENEQLKSAAPVASKDDQAAQVAAAKLTEAEESNRALSQQNEQLKDQVDRLSGQIDQLTAQAAQASGKADVAAQLAAVQNERDQYRVSARDMSGRLQEAQQQAASYQQQLNDAKKHLDALQQQAAQASSDTVCMVTVTPSMLYEPFAEPEIRVDRSLSFWTSE